jgi:sialic acid synthase SpsE
MKSLKLGSKRIDNLSTPYFIAEVGVNHENDLNRAKRLIYLAKKGGADGVKFQTYKAEKIACKRSPYYWDIKEIPVNSQYKLFKKFDKFGPKEYKILKKYCDKLKIDFLSTPFDLEAVDYLNKLVPFFKVASADLTNYPLIKRICSKKKPIVLSTGASKLKEIQNTINYIKKISPKIKVIILHCVLSYPTKYDNAHLEIIKNLSAKFPNNIIGLSDHTLPDEDIAVLTSSYILGARVIEKHFSDKKGKKGNDHFHSLDFKDLRKFIEKIKFIQKLIKKTKGRPLLQGESISRKNARRSIVTLGEIRKGQKLTYKNLIMKRPGTGISPTTIKRVIGKVVKRNLKDDYILKFSDFK